MKRILIIAIGLYMMICFSGCGNNPEESLDYNDHDYSVANSNDNFTVSVETETEAEVVIETYPCLWMREKDLKNTKLGAPTSIELCKDFKYLDPRKQYKEYKWEGSEGINSGRAIVEYERHFSNHVDDYETYPSDNGYVSWIQYIDENGVLHEEDELKQHEQGIYQ